MSTTTSIDCSATGTGHRDARAKDLDGGSSNTSLPWGPGRMNDRNMMQAVAAGDQQAFGLLFANHAAAVLQIALKYLKDRDAAEDLLHDVFIEAQQRASSYDPARGDPAAWLAVLAKSRAIDRIRAINRYNLLIANYQLAPDTGQHSIADDILFRNSLPRLMSTLSSDHRQVVELFYLQDLTQSEISAQLGIAKGTVKSRLHFAVKKLHANMEQG